MMPTLRTTLRRAASAAALAVVTATLPAPSEAESAKLVAGTLTCKGHGGVGLILGSQETLSCVFNSASSGHRHRYVATITKIGLDISIKGESTLVWTVLSSTTELPKGALAGTYGGVTAGATVGVGGGANALVGGSSNSIALQPVSVQGGTGLNLSAGVAGLTLRRG